MLQLNTFFAHFSPSIFVCNLKTYVLHGRIYIYTLFRSRLNDPLSSSIRFDSSIESSRWSSSSTHSLLYSRTHCIHSTVQDVSYAVNELDQLFIFSIFQSNNFSKEIDRRGKSKEKEEFRERTTDY